MLFEDGEQKPRTAQELHNQLPAEVRRFFAVTANSISMKYTKAVEVHVGNHNIPLFEQACELAKAAGYDLEMAIEQVPEGHTPHVCMVQANDPMAFFWVGAHFGSLTNNRAQK